MNKKLLSFFLSSFLGFFAFSQTVSVFNNVPFYSMYHYLGAGETLPPEAYSEIPAGAIRMHAYERDIISRKLTDAEISSIGSQLTMNVTLIAACDNYDRIAGVNLALVPKGSTTYEWGQTDVKRIEIGRFITPFMNKNVSPTEVPYTYRIDNIAKILHDSALMATYDAWIEFRADGYSAAAQTQVAGCADRTDVFRGTLELVSEGTAQTANSFLLPLSYRQNLNNYSATDVPGETTRIVSFDLSEPVENVTLHFINSNHGSNSGGEEYVRRNHFIYLDDQLIYDYKPGGNTCEPFRQYNTQGNGIYGTTVKTLRNWLSWNNWCPGDAIPNREINLGNLSAGTHTIKIDVPDAVFTGGQGYFPISMYLQNSKNGQVICTAPANLAITSQVSNVIHIDWDERGTATDWQVVWGRRSAYNTIYDFYQDVSGDSQSYRDNLTQYWIYEMYVQSKCASDLRSVWVGPATSTSIVLGTDENKISNVSVFPNPAKDVVNLKSDLPIKKAVIYDVSGKIISEQNTSTIDVSNFSKGVYMMTIYFQNGTTSLQKFIKE